MNKIPEFLLELSKQMKEQPTQGTAHALWQVRTRQQLLCPKEYSADYCIYSPEGRVVYSSREHLKVLTAYLIKNYTNFCIAWVEENYEDIENIWGRMDKDFNPEDYDLPKGLRKVYQQTAEVVISTHLTEAEALAFIKRKQHDYPELYTHVESAHASPQLIQLQDWIMSL